jgi:hypothetical protein
MVATLAAGAAVCTAPRDCTRERLGHSLQRTAATHVRYISLSLSLSLSRRRVHRAARLHARATGPQPAAHGRHPRAWPLRCTQRCTPYLSSETAT